MTLIRLAVAILFIVFALQSEAKLIQIIHTNDLHSFFEGSRVGKGGYARIKTLIDNLREDAKAKGIPTLHLDAGDFGEGSSFYFAKKGVDSLHALELLGVDATVLGNHDFMLGANDLARQLEEAKFKPHLLSANLVRKTNMGLKERILDSVDYKINGLKIRIFGLTTHEIHFQYPLTPQGFIAPALTVGMQQDKKAGDDNVDFLIALTHIGVVPDVRLAKRSKNLDLVVGGHSHTRLEHPTYQKNKIGKNVPILQTGAHGTAVGSILIDIRGKGDSTVLDYRLYDIDRSISEDTKVKNFVKQAYHHREQYFNRQWDEVIGFSDIDLTGLVHGEVEDGRSCWSRHIARLTRTVSQTDIGAQFDIFQGERIPAGPITFGDLIDNLPHFRTWGDKGWVMAKAKISGITLKEVIKLSTDPRITLLGATFDGVEAVDPSTGKLVPFITGGVHGADWARVKGKEIENMQFYTISLPNEIPRSVDSISVPIRELLLSGSQIVPKSDYWPLFEKYIRDNSPLRCLEN